MNNPISKPKPPITDQQIVANLLNIERNLKQAHEDLDKAQDIARELLKMVEGR